MRTRDRTDLPAGEGRVRQRARELIVENLGLGVVRLVRDRAYPVTLPLEIRFGAADDAYLSPAHGRATCYVACHVHHRLPWEPFLRDAGELLASRGGRPHWGKHHWGTATTLRRAYPAWDDFRAVRRRLDPDGRFANAYVRRVLGAP